MGDNSSAGKFRNTNLIDLLFEGEPMSIDQLHALIRENWAGDVAWEISDRFREMGEPVPKTLMANVKRTEEKIFKRDFVEITVEKSNLDNFRFSNGKLNVRALARHVQSTLKTRNASLVLRQRPIRNIGLRTIENAI